MNLGILCGGRSGEHEVSLQSAQSIYDAVERDRFSPMLVAIDKEGGWRMGAAGDLLRERENPARIHLNPEAPASAAEPIHVDDEPLMSAVTDHPSFGRRLYLEQEPLAVPLDQFASVTHLVTDAYRRTMPDVHPRADRLLAPIEMGLDTFQTGLLHLLDHIGRRQYAGTGTHMCHTHLGRDGHRHFMGDTWRYAILHRVLSL